MSVLDQIVQPRYLDVGHTPVYRFENSPGNLLLSATPMFDGQSLCDIFTLIPSAITGPTAEIRVECQFSDQSQHGVEGFEVERDGTTHYAGTLVRGWDLVFAVDAGLLSTARSKIYSGVWTGVATAGNPSGYTLDEMEGPSDPGPSSGNGAGAVHYLGAFGLKNVSEALWSGAIIRPITPWQDKPTSGSVFKHTALTIDATPMPIVGPAFHVDPYLVTCANKDGPGAGKIAIRWNGLEYACIEVATGIATTTAAVKYDADALYMITEGPLNGKQFVPHPDITNASTSEFRVWPRQYVEIADYNSGNPVTWVNGDVGLEVVSEVDGEVPANAEPPIAVRLKFAAGARSNQNPVQIVLIIVAAVGGGTGA